MDSKARILVVDDEEDIIDLLAYNLEREGYETLVARDGVEAMQRALAEQPDLIVLDVMMPRMDGLEVARRLREDAVLRHTPILMLTAKSEEKDHVQGLDVGADIYISKPVSIPVLLSQTRALLRGMRRGQEPPDLLRVHGLEINRDRYLIYENVDGEAIELRLPRKEFELLYFLASNPGRVFSRQELLDAVWGSDVFVIDRTVDVHVRKIREKLSDDVIETVKGVGYRLRA
ncbi:MAG TPA: response regulator transcription factor [Rhodothermales bacterium]